MSWIKKFVDGSFSLYSGNTVSAFQPLDFFHFYPLYYDLWIKEFVKVMERLDLENKKFSEIKNFLPTPSNMRAIFQKLIPSYAGLRHKTPAEYKRVSNFFARMLAECCPDDPFGKNSNPYYSKDEVKEIVQNTNWAEGDPVTAKTIGKLITATGSFVHGLYNDVVTDFGWDTYGPFQYQQYSLLIRHFPNLKPQELWPTGLLSSIKEIKIFGLYEDVGWKIGCVGCHTIVTNGSPITGLKKYCVMGDSKILNQNQIGKLIEDLSLKAENIYAEIRKKDFEDIKRMVMLQECYQLKKLFDAAHLDWRPTEQMYARVRNKPLLKNLIPLGKLMTSKKEYIDSFGIRVFAKEVLGETI